MLTYAEISECTDFDLLGEFLKKLTRLLENDNLSSRRFTELNKKYLLATEKRSELLEISLENKKHGMVGKKNAKKSVDDLKEIIVKARLNSEMKRKLDFILDYQELTFSCFLRDYIDDCYDHLYRDFSRMQPLDYE